MRKHKLRNLEFICFLLIIVFFGLLLRLKDYSKVPPPDEIFDELHYAWGGKTWLDGGTPKSWSYYSSYQNFEFFERYGVRWKIVSPLIEKPPLYFLVNGIILGFISPEKIFEVEHSQIRILPIILGTVSIFLTGLVGKKLFTSHVGLLAALIFSIVPTIVLANRINVTEALITPFALSVTYLLTKTVHSKRNYISLTAGVISFFAILTKHVGISVGVSAAIPFLLERQWKNLLIILGFILFAFGTFFAFGFIYDPKLFINLQNDLRVHTLAGLPETIQSIFRYPGVSAKNRPFYDGTILAGWILLFTAPFWITNLNFVKNKDITKSKMFILLLFPFTFLSLISLGESGSGPFNFFGIYLFPVLPYLSIIFALFIWRIWKTPAFAEAFFLLLIVGPSTVRFFFLNLPMNYHYLWQYTLILIYFLFLIAWLAGLKARRYLLAFYFLIFVLVNILVDFRLMVIYSPVVEKSQNILNLFN